jgi:hypothetical protein
MKIETSVVRKIGWLIVGLLVLFLAWCSSGATKSCQPKSPAPVLIPHDSSGPYGWIGGVHARMLANLLGHFQLSYRIVPVESCRAGDLSAARATFYLGTTCDTPLPAVLLQEAMATTKPVCGFKFHPFFDLDYLRELVQGIKGLGYSYVPLFAGIE